MAPPNTNKQSSTGKVWREWAIQAQSGDKKAYRKLLKAISPFIRNYLAGGLANPDWADDIAQEVLVSVHKSLKTYAADRPFMPWLMAIVAFRRTDFLRKHYRENKHQQTSLDNPEFMKSHVTDDEYLGEYGDIERVLQELPEKQRKLFRMIKIQGYTTKEVANEMGMSESAVKVSAHRAMKKLKDKFA